MKKFISLVLVALIITACYFQRDKIKSMYSEISEIFLNGMLKEEEIVDIKYEEYEIRNPQFQSCFNVLNSKQKEFYKVIYSISQEMTEGFIKLGYNYNGASRDVNIAYKAFLYDYPDIFWMPKDYILGTSSKGKNQKIAIALDYHKNVHDYNYPVSKSQKTKMLKSLNVICNRVIKKTEKLSSEYEKEKYINDYLCENVKYNEKADFCDTAYGALVNGKALCEGYSKAFMLLCTMAGIECELIVGESEGVGHMWNRVNIDKKLSYVDVTWNDRSELKAYTYFNITEAQLLVDHIIAPLFSELKSDTQKTLFNFTKKDCSYTGNTFYEKNGRVLWSDYAVTAPSEIEEAASNGEEYAEFLFATENILKEFNDDPQRFINRIQSGLYSLRINSYSNERDTIILFFE